MTSHRVVSYLNCLSILSMIISSSYAFLEILITHSQMANGRGNYEWAKTPAGVHPLFQFFSTAGRRAPSGAVATYLAAVATYLASWNNAEFQPKMPPPHISTQWELLPRWLRERSSSLSHKCSVEVLFKLHHKYLGRCNLKSNCARIQYCTLADRFPFRTVRLAAGMRHRA